jgi:predicted transcriptional regulator
MAGRPPIAPSLGDLEREVMEAVWDSGESSVRSVLDALNAASSRQRAYTTVMTVLVNLCRKGLLERKRHGRGYLYSPAMSRGEYARARARQEVEALLHDYGDAALVSFAREVDRLDPHRRRALRRLADDG